MEVDKFKWKSIRFVYFRDSEIREKFSSEMFASIGVSSTASKWRVGKYSFYLGGGKCDAM